MRYFVTGATGFIGGKLARALIGRGHEVITLARNPAKAADLAALGVEVAKGDITEKDTLRDPMRGADGIFHVAGWYKIGTRDASQGQAINVDGTRNVLEVMRELAIPKGVYTSTLAVNSNTHGQIVDESYRFKGAHITEYDRTKADAHHIAEAMIADGLPLVIVMPGLVYGPDDTSSTRTTLRQLIAGKLPMLPQGTTFAWAHVDDIVEGHILAMEKGKVGESYIIAGEVKTLSDAMDMAAGIAGVSAPRMRPTPGLMNTMSGIMGVLERVIPLPETFSSEMMRIMSGVSYIGSNEKARRELGYQPRPLAEGMRETVLHEMAIAGKQ